MERGAFRLVWGEGEIKAGAPMLVIFPVRDRIELLPYFLKYYTTIGATRFVCGLYGGRKSPLYKPMAAFQKKYDLAILSSGEIAYEEFNARLEAVGLNKIRRKVVKRGEWYAIADLDEFHYCKGRTLPEVAAAAQAAGCHAVQGIFRDRIAADGQFPRIHGRLDDTFPLACRLTSRAGLSSRKIVLAKWHVAIAPGHHRANTKVLPKAAWVQHFKWSAGVSERAAQMHQRYTQQGRRWAIRDLPRLQRLIQNGVNLNDRRLHIEPAVRLGI